jgi:hypothetical protein
MFMCDIMWIAIHIIIWVKSMRTIQMTIDDVLLGKVDRASQTLGVPRSAFIRRALETALRDLKIAHLEQQHIAGYQQKPAAEGEFDVWESEQIWD